MISLWFGKLLKVYVIVILLLIAVAARYYLVYDGATGDFGKTVLLLAALVLAGSISFISVKLFAKNKYYFYSFIILLSVVSCTLWNVFADTQPVSDYEVLIDAGKKIANGNFIEAFNKDNYFYFYNFQIGYTAYIGLVFKLFQTGLTALKILDIAYVSLSSILVFAIVGQISDKNKACIAASLYAVFIPNVMGSSVVNNQHLSTFLMLFGIFMLFKQKLIYIGIGSIFISLMNIFRPVGVILLIAVPVYFFYNAINKKEYMSFIKNTAVFLTVFYVMTWSVDAVMINAQLTPSAISSPNLPYYKLIIGMANQNGSIYGNTTEDARKTAVYFDLKQNNFDYDYYNKESLDFLKDRLTDITSTKKYIFEKMRYFLGERDNQFIFALAADKAEIPFVNLLVTFGHIQYLILVILALCSVLIQLISNDNRWILIQIALAGFISVYVLIEAQTRYRYEAYLIIIMLASHSLSYFLSKVQPALKDT